MSLTVSNQTPAVLSPIHLIPCSGDYDVTDALDNTIIQPLLTPLVAGTQVQIVDAHGRDAIPNIMDQLIVALDEDRDPDAEDFLRDVYSQTLLHYNNATSLTVHDLFVNQAATRNKLPAPSNRVLYSAKDDVVPAAKALLSGTSDDSLLLAGLGFTFHLDTLGFWFRTEQAFIEFQAWLSQQITTMSTTLPPETLQLMGDFQTLTLDGLTESLRIRKNDDDGNEEFSFPRLIVRMLMQYAKNEAQLSTPGVGVLPLSLAELFNPLTLVFVNVERHARARPRDVEREWKLIESSLASPVRVISNKKLAKLTALPRAAMKAQVQAQRRKFEQAGRSAKVAFRKKAPTSVDIAADLARALKRMGTVNRSQNILRVSKTSFNKANRRDPNDYNKPGRATSTKYMPDIHLFIDTSGSISEANYQDAVTMLIRVAKKLGVNLYINTFSHILSQETMLRVEGRTVAQIWNHFRTVPKVTGGTEFKQVWDYINASPERKRRLSLMITDFEWPPPSQRVEHPKNLYYAPCSAMNWDRLVAASKRFTTHMGHIEPAIAQRLMGVIL